jgi:hypothetical protein
MCSASANKANKARIKVFLRCRKLTKSTSPGFLTTFRRSWWTAGRARLQPRRIRGCRRLLVPAFQPRGGKCRVEAPASRDHRSLKKQCGANLTRPVPRLLVGMLLIGKPATGAAYETCHAHSGELRSYLR